MAIKEISLNGKLIKGSDPLVVGQNFVDLINMRYTKTNPRAINGMSKINSTAISTYPKIKNSFHFVKTLPSNLSYTLVQGYNSSETASQVLVNKTAIPSTGDFETTALHTDASNADVGKFSEAPGSTLAYCNSAETLIWGGDEARCTGFIVYDPATETTIYDYSDVITNTLDDSNNIATISNTSAGIDANTLLMLHLNNNVTDVSPTTPHTVTNTNVTFDAVTKVFGSHSAVFNGSSSELTIPDNADFDFSGGNFTIDVRCRFDSLYFDNTIFYQDDAPGNYVYLEVHIDGSIHFGVFESAGGTEVVEMLTAASTVVLNTFYHIEIVEDGDNYYLFVDGTLKAAISDTNRPSNYTQNIHIGSFNGAGEWFDGYMDEFRVSNVSRHTQSFEIPTVEYTTSTDSASIYLGSLLPLKAFKLYIKTANTTTGTLSIEYWNGSAWTSATSVVDGTSLGGDSLAQTGTITFDDTKSLAQLKIINSTQIYWYKISITAADASTSIYHCTVNYTMQSIKDIWDGIHDTCLSCQKVNTSTNVSTDYTTNVFAEDYLDSSLATYLHVKNMPTTLYVASGFLNRQSGIFVVIGDVSDTITVMTVEYWNGSAWVTVDGLVDETSSGGISLGKSGTITWNTPPKSSEFKTNIARDIPLYYYKISFSGALGTATTIDNLVGLPTQEEIGNYSFPVLGQNRLWLCNQTNEKKNSARCSSAGSFSIFNGADSLELTFGDNKKLIAGASIYAQYGSNIYDVMIFCKETETWIVVGSSPDTWGMLRASKIIGCVAPLTMITAHISAEITEGLNRHVAIWQASDGIYLFDGQVPTRLDGDIDAFFDPASTGVNQINPDMLDKSTMFMDEVYQELHWCFATDTSTELNREFVYSFKKNGWFEVDRNTNNNLWGGLSVIDTTGNKYQYGYNDQGYLWRLENGTSFDGAAINCTLQTGDIIFEESLIIQNSLLYWSLTALNKSTPITANLYLDSRTTSTHTYTIDADDFYTGRRISTIPKDGTRENAVLHSFKFETTSTTEAPNFEPLVLSCNYNKVKLNKN